MTIWRQGWPAIEGYYWVRRDALPTLCKVSTRAFVALDTHEVRVYADADWSDAWFAGPLAPPAFVQIAGIAYAYGP